MMSGMSASTLSMSAMTNTVNTSVSEGKMNLKADETSFTDCFQMTCLQSGTVYDYFTFDTTTYAGSGTTVMGACQMCDEDPKTGQMTTTFAESSGSVSMTNVGQLRFDNAEGDYCAWMSMSATMSFSQSGGSEEVAATAYAHAGDLLIQCTLGAEMQSQTPCGFTMACGCTTDDDCASFTLPISGTTLTGGTCVAATDENGDAVDIDNDGTNDMACQFSGATLTALQSACTSITAPAIATLVPEGVTCAEETQTFITADNFCGMEDECSSGGSTGGGGGDDGGPGEGDVPAIPAICDAGGADGSCADWDVLSDPVPLCFDCLETFCTGNPTDEFCLFMQEMMEEE